MSSLGNFVKRLRDIMRNDAGINGDAQRIEQIAWLLFLKVYDTKEEDWEFDDDDYESIIPEECRWRNWAVDDSKGSAMAQYKRDLKLVRPHMGYDPTRWNFAEKFSEFSCDSPIIECSTDNILRKVQEKGEKHKSGNTDLFIFVLEDEFRVMTDLLQSGPQNGCYGAFFNPILRSPFPVVYVCAWNWEAQTYETEKPLIMKFEKTDTGGVTARCI